MTLAAAASEASGASSASLSPRSAWWLRVAVALVIGLNAALFAMSTIQSPNHVTYTDFEFYWRAMQLWRAGIDPYVMQPGVWPASWPLRDRLFYPVPALLLVRPMHALTFPLAAGVFAGASAAWLAWIQTKAREWWRLLIFCSAMFVTSVMYGQWSPLLTVGALIPAAACLLTSKPSLGVACFLYRPTVRGAISATLLVALSLALWPTWPFEWLANLSGVRNHPAPITTPFGWMLLLAFVRWRQPEARLLLGMAVVPQLFAFADQLPLALVARNRREALCLSLGSFAAWIPWHMRIGDPPDLRPMTAYVMAGVYLPALWIVLRRANEGPMPAWIERAVSALPVSLRGMPKSTARSA